MTGYLIDTNCISELVRVKPEPRFLQWIGDVDEHLLFLSVLTLGEIRKGLASLPQSRRRARIETWLDVDVSARFAGRILSVDTSVANRWGVLAAEARATGRPLPVVDGLLAATALHHNLTLVSRNVSDFKTTRVSVLNPWKALT